MKTLGGAIDLHQVQHSLRPALHQKGLIGLGRMVVALRLSPIFLLGCFVGLTVAQRMPSFSSAPGHYVRQGGYRYIQPLLDYEVAQQMERATPRLKQHIAALVNERVRDKAASHVLVYFRDLNNGPWFGIHERETFAPASLYKLPLLIAFLKQAESNPQLLAQRLAYTADMPIKQSMIKPSNVIDEGKLYSIEELLERMIVHSDNRALMALSPAVDQKALARTLSDLGLPSPEAGGSSDLVSVKAYSALFRILFNASYLRPEMSEKALGWLTRVDVQQGLVAGVPSGVAVAHKFGERRLEDGKTLQFHDCGIVYASGRPYLLCV